MSPFRAGVALALLALCAAAQAPVALRDVESLVFEAGKMTAGRRLAPVPQMSQTGGPRVPVRGIFCRNVGWDGRDVNWECRLPADTPAQLGGFAIQCEGYGYAGDPLHLAGSCGIEYSLLPPVGAPPPPPRAGATATSAHGSSNVFVVFVCLTGAMFLLLLSGGAFLKNIPFRSPRPAPVANLLDLDDPPVRPARRAGSWASPPAPHVHIHHPQSASAALVDLAAINLAASAMQPAAGLSHRASPGARPAAAPAEPAVAHGKSNTDRGAAPAAYGRSNTDREVVYEPAAERGRSTTAREAGDASFWSSLAPTARGSAAPAARDAGDGWAADSAAGKSAKSR